MVRQPSQVAQASFASLAALVEKSLVQLESADRFSIHELLRQYGMEQLEAYGETEATYARHSHYFAQLMLRHEAALKQPQQLDTMQAIERDFENIRLAWEWSAKNQHVTQLHAMLNGLYLFGFLRSRYRETITMFQHTLEQSVADAPLLGRLLARRWGYLHWWYQADYQEALTSIEQALTIARAENNRFEIAFCHLMAAYAMISMQRYAEALPHLETSQALFEAIDEPYYVCWVLHRLGYVYSNLNNIDRGNEYTEQSLALARATHNRVALVICLYNLGSDYILGGDYVKGRQYCAEALQVATESGHQGQIAHALSLLALCAFVKAITPPVRNMPSVHRRSSKTSTSCVFQPYSLSVADSSGMSSRGLRRRCPAQRIGETSQHQHDGLPTAVLGACCLIVWRRQPSRSPRLHPKSASASGTRAKLCDNSFGLFPVWRIRSQKPILNRPLNCSPGSSRMRIAP